MQINHSEIRINAMFSGVTGQIITCNTNYKKGGKLNLETQRVFTASSEVRCNDQSEDSRKIRIEKV